MSLLKLFAETSFIPARELGRAAFWLRKEKIYNKVLYLSSHISRESHFSSEQCENIL